MTRGRRNVPSQEMHGIWFQHAGESKTMPRRRNTTTGEMLETGQTVDHNAHVKLTPEFISKINTPIKERHSFSVHDNRHTIQDRGEYFEQRLGRLKVSASESQHSSEDIVTWEGRDRERSSIYRDSFSIGTKSAGPRGHRRFPKQHPTPDPSHTKPSTATLDWAGNQDHVTPAKFQTLADTQEPHLKHNNWRYAYHRHTHQFKPKKVID